MRLIDADALNRYLSNLEYANRGWKDEFADTVGEFIEVVDEQPTIDPESLRKKGEWINWGKSGTPTYEHYGTCSVCHEDAEIYTEHRNFCPNCGAGMRMEAHNGC